MGDSKEDAVWLFGALVEELCMDVCFEAHHKYYLTRYLASKGRKQRDVFGRFPRAATDSFKCHNCHRPVSSSKYAQHLEKCMGRGGRQRAKRTSSDARLSTLSTSSKSYRHQNYGSK